MSNCYYYIVDVSLIEPGAFKTNIVRGAKVVAEKNWANVPRHVRDEYGQV